MTIVWRALMAGMFVIAGSMLYGQQLPLYAKYTFNRFAINPAYAGNKNRIEAIASHRDHLKGFVGAPSTQVISVSAPYQKKYVAGGLRIVNDKLGVTNQLSAALAANYYIGFGPGRLAVGMEFGFHQYAVDWAQLYKADPNDPNIPDQRESVIVPDGGFGLFYNTETTYFGYSMLHMFGSDLSMSSDSEAKLYKHHYFNVGTVLEMGKNLHMEPSMLVKMTKAAPLQVDIGAHVVFKQLAGAGVAYRTGDAIYFTAKVNIKEQYSVGYSYGIRANKLRTYSPNSHEIMLQYNYKLMEPARKKVIHPRYYF